MNFNATLMRFMLSYVFIMYCMHWLQIMLCICRTQHIYKILDTSARPVWLVLLDYLQNRVRILFTVPMHTNAYGIYDHICQCTTPHVPFQ